MVCRPIWVMHIKQCRQARVWLLRNLSAKKINKPFDHKGPIHSLTLMRTLAFCLSLTPPPPHFSLVISPWPSLSQSALFRFLPFILHQYVCFWKKKNNKSWPDEPRDRGMDGQAGRPVHKDFFISQGGSMTWKISSSLHITWSGTSAQSPPHTPLFKIFSHAHASCLISNKRAFVRVFSYACECSCVKRPSSPITLLFWLCAPLSLWVWLHYHLPPQAYFPFSKHSRLPLWKTSMNWAPSETSRQQARKTFYCHYTPHSIKVYIKYIAYRIE